MTCPVHKTELEQCPTCKAPKHCPQCKACYSFEGNFDLARVVKERANWLPHHVTTAAVVD